MKKALLVIFGIAVAVALAPAAASGSDLTTVINFTCSGHGVAGPGKKTLPIGSGCTAAKNDEGMASYSPLSTWRQQSESGPYHYAVLSTAFSAGLLTDVNGTSTSNGAFVAEDWDYDSSNGFNWSGQTTANGVTGVPSLSNGLLPDTTDQLEIIYNDAQSPFYLDAFYLGESATSDLDYMIFGYDGDTLVYCIDSNGDSCSGTLSNDWVSLGTVTHSGSGVFYTEISNPDWYIPVTSVYIDTKISGTSLLSFPDDYLDNLEVTQTPEPMPVVLLGTGLVLLGLGGLLRRRLAGAAAAVHKPTIV